MPGVGEIVAEAVAQYLADEHNRETLDRLSAAGLRLVEEQPQRVDGAPRGDDLRPHREAAHPHAR